MKRRLSSLQTFLLKIVLPAVWIPLLGFFNVTALAGGSDDLNAVSKWLYLGVWVATSAVVYWNGVRLKTVSVDDNFLYVSNYLKEISIPLSDIYDVTENVWFNNHPVTIHLRSPSEFGDKIVFIPTARVFAMFSSHSVVNELKELARSSSLRTLR